jgi:hypothetical protein
MEEALMERILTSVATVALTVGAMIIIPSLAAGQTAPPIGGGYQNVIPIPVDDPSPRLSPARCSSRQERVHSPPSFT